MDPLKWLELATTYLTQYVEQMQGVLVRPSSYFLRDQPQQAIQPVALVLDGSFWAFAILSVVIGFSVQLYVFPEHPELSQKIAVLCATWFAFAIYAHVLCAMALSGTGQFTQSAAASVRAIAASYLISSVVAFLVALGSKALGHAYATGISTTYLAVQAVVIGVCGGLALARVHTLGQVRRAMLVLALPLPTLFYNGAVLFKDVHVGGPK